MTKRCVVYQITNNINGRRYIGAHSTTNIDDGYMGSGKLISRAIKKYGKDNFTKTILHESSTQEEMFLKEKELVEAARLTDGKRLYNIIPGGTGNTTLPEHIKKHKKGIYALTKEERSSNSKAYQATVPDDVKKARASKAGTANWIKNKDKKFGFHSLSPEQKKQNALRASRRSRELGKGFCDPRVQSELGKRGGVKNRGFRWYNDGTNQFKYTAKEQSNLPFEDFMKQNPQFKEGRFKVKYTPRVSKGRVSVTNGVKNKMLTPDEAIIFLEDNTDYRFGRTNFK